MWLDKLSGVVQGGDKPFGNFWLAIAERPSLFHFPQKTKVGEKVDPNAPLGSTGPMVDVFEWQPVWVLDQAAQDAATAAAARLSTDASEQASVKLDAQVQTFLNFTPAQLDAWVATNIEAAGLTLAQVKANSGTAFKVLGRIALAAGRGRTLR